MSELSDLSAIMEGAHLAGSLPYIEAQLDKQMDACIVRMDKMLTDGKLSPDLAQMAWIELLSYRRLKRRMGQQVRIATTAGERQATLLAPEPPLPI